MFRYLDIAIRQYYSIVNTAYNEFVDYVKENLSVEIDSISDLYEFLRKSQELRFVISGKTYHFHGDGCSVWFRDMQIISWDFGYRSWLCGIDPYKLALTLSNTDGELGGTYDADQISDMCKAEVDSGNMIEHSGQYYINLLSLETESYSFPSEYDILIIEKNTKRFVISRTNAIDRFIRKSSKVYKHIDELNNNFVLVFMKNNVEVGRYLYNDIAYPESAVRIMDELIHLSGLQ